MFTLDKVFLKCIIISLSLCVSVKLSPASCQICQVGKCEWLF